ncbi:E3 ubiquitin-protein ligase PUB23-like [Arachis stenosperma]|uniref:E3 ubiquitin-protein ligase PUB23-like n=1 Tax=Arachis stenosperma TaxID=217475 RepID=UPI0025AB71AE|nr:E3 ubiquitin-protein ligase PUB23-like [Arachis stenosperma]
MAEIKVPELLLCPISLEIMKDPVTTVTGITYDRESIEEWLQQKSNKKDCMCPVTKQPLPTDPHFLTPNHTLRRFIQGWCSANQSNGVDRITTPRSPLDNSQLHKLLTDLDAPRTFQTSLNKMHDLATQSQRNRNFMAQQPVPKAMVQFITTTFKQGETSGVEEALRILRLLWRSTSSSSSSSSSPTGGGGGTNMKPLVGETLDFIKSLTWILQLPIIDNDLNMVNEAMQILKLTIEITDSTLLGSLNHEFFKQIVSTMTRLSKSSSSSIPQNALKSALHVLIETCPLGRNRTKIVESGAVGELIELSMDKPTEKNLTELIFKMLGQLCSCAEGREEFLKHPAGIAVVSKRTLRVSAATDDGALHVLWLISKFSATNEVVQEMLRVGAVSKLCMVMQADCASYLKQKATDILRFHSKAWNNSPCIQLYLLTRHPR